MKSRFKGRRIEELEERIDQLEQFLDEDSDLYEPPDEALEIYNEELENCREWKASNPIFFKVFFKRKADVESLAFYLLPENVQRRLIN